MAATSTSNEEKKVKEVLVIGGDPSVDWKSIFKGAKTIDGCEVVVTWSDWNNLILNSYSDGCGCMATVPARGGSSFKPDITLIRGALRSSFGNDNRNLLLALAFGGSQVINSVQSLWLCQEKPLVHYELQKIRKKLGKNEKGEWVFPLIDQSFFPTWRSMTFIERFPQVAKIGTVHAGLGKMKLESMQQFTDLRSVMALQQNYVTCEDFIDWDHDFRIQKIGPHIRGFTRTSDNWKGASMASRDIDVPVTDIQRLWLDEVSTSLGMDILTIDGVHSKSGKDYIVEVNDSAIGLNSRHLEEDFGYIRELILSKLEQQQITNTKSAQNGSNVSRSDDPMAIALEHAQEELKNARARINELEQQIQQQKQQTQGKGLFGKFRS